jgi:preprotein translocase subunit SecG
MTTVLLILHLFVTLALIGIVLIQRSEGGGLGIGTAQGMGGFMSGRGTANLLTRATAVLATLFMGIALVLALLDRGAGSSGRGLLDLSPPPAATVLPGPPAKGVTLPAAPAPTTPAPGASTPAKPAAPPVPTN